jgi:hypothetical protein
MKNKLFSIIVRYFPEEFFNITERHEKIGAWYFVVDDKDTEGKNIHASFFIYENEPNSVSIEINNVLAKSEVDDCGEAILKVLNDAIELRERYLKISEHQKKLIDLEKIRKGESIKEIVSEEPKEKQEEKTG